MTSSRWIVWLGKTSAVAALTVGLAMVVACRSTARAKAHVEQGDRHSAQKQFALAEREYRQAIEISPDFADAYYRLGLLQIQLEHPTAARQSLSRALELDPKNPGARL